MNTKYTVLAVAYRKIGDDVKKKLDALSIRKIDEIEDLQNFCSYGRQMDQNSRVCIYLDWYRQNILRYLGMGYEVALIELPRHGDATVVESLKQIDIELGDELLVIEEDHV
ncbi:MAG: hypothetical protein Q4A52_05725 [Bacillota bacterium]|nr:hypothetical protein [Bacillota bacterium]